MKKHLLTLVLMLTLMVSATHASDTWTWGVSTGDSYKLELTDLYTNAVAGNLAILLPEENKTALIAVVNVDSNVLYYVMSSLTGEDATPGNITMTTMSIEGVPVSITYPEGLPFFLPLQTPDIDNYLEYAGETLTILTSSLPLLLGGLNMTGIGINATSTYSLDDNTFETTTNAEISLHVNSTADMENITQALNSLDLSSLGIPLSLDEMGITDFLNATDFYFTIDLTLDYNATTGAFTAIDTSIYAESWMANSTAEHDVLTLAAKITMTPFTPEIDTTSLVSSILSSLSENGDNSFSTLGLITAFIAIPALVYTLRRKH